MAGSDDRGAVDADEPEEAHGAVDHSKADVAVGGSEQGLEHLDDALGKAEAKGSAKDDVKDPKDGDADGEGDDVLKSLRNVGRNLLGHLDGDVALDKELIDDAGHKRSDEGGQQALGAKVGGVEAAGSVCGDGVARKEQEADDGRAHARDKVDLVVLGQVAVLSVGEVLGRGGGTGDGQDAHGVVVALPQGVVDVIGPVETPDVGDRSYQTEDGREDDDGDDGDKTVADCLEVLVAGDRVGKRAGLFRWWR